MPRDPFDVTLPKIPTMDEVLYGKKPRRKKRRKTTKKPKTTRRKIDKNTRDAVWLKYMGNKAEGKCYCCRIRTIHITNFQVGHNKARARGGKDNINNLRPICSPCNRGMGTMSIEAYRKKYFGTSIKKKTTNKKRKPKKKVTRRKTKRKKK